jgi:hypothetical protein
MATNATGIESGTAVDSVDSLVVVKTARKMRHTHHVICTCMVGAGESGLVQPIDKSSNDSAKSFVTRSTGNRKAEVGVSRPRPQVLNGGGGIASLIILDRLRRTALLPPGVSHFQAVLFGMSGQTAATPTTAPVSQPCLLVDDSFVMYHFPLVSSATEQLPDRSDSLTGYPPTTTRDLGSERRNAAVAISREPQRLELFTFILCAKLQDTYILP